MSATHGLFPNLSAKPGDGQRSIFQLALELAREEAKGAEAFGLQDLCETVIH